MRDALSTLTSRASSALAACGGGARRSSLHASAASAIGAREEPTRSDQCSGVPQPFRTLLGSLDTPVAPSHRSRRERRAKPPSSARATDSCHVLLVHARRRSRRFAQGRSRQDPTSAPACRSRFGRPWALWIRPSRHLIGAVASGERSRRRKPRTSTLHAILLLHAPLPHYGCFWEVKRRQLTSYRHNAVPASAGDCHGRGGRG